MKTEFTIQVDIKTTNTDGFGSERINELTELLHGVALDWMGQFLGTHTVKTSKLHVVNFETTCGR